MRICALILAVAFPWHAAATQPEPLRIDPPFVPSSMEMVERMLLMADAGPDDVVYDLGSGDGRIPITAAQKFGVKKAVGVELDAELVRKSIDNARRAGVSDRAHFRQGDVFEVDFSDATIVTLYMFQHINIMLRPRLLKELRPGTRVVSHEFHMGEWLPDRSLPHTDVPPQNIVVDDEDVPYIFSWIVPAQVGGAWDLSLGPESDRRMQLTQQFQMIAGEVQMEGGTAAVRGGRLTGERIRFELVPGNGGEAVHRFDGRVDGAEMRGTVVMPDGRTESFRASRAN